MINILKLICVFNLMFFSAVYAEPEVDFDTMSFDEILNYVGENPESVDKLSDENLEKLLTKFNSFLVKPDKPLPVPVDLKKEELPFPFVQFPVEKVFAEFLRLQKTEKERTPVLLGTPEAIRKYAPGTFSDNDSVEATLKKAEKIDVKKWLADRATEEELGELPSSDWPSEVADLLEVNVYQMAWAGDHPKVVIGLLPTKKPWEVFAHLNWGGWNSTPMPEEHVALFKYWYEKYKAVPVSVDGDVVQVMLETVPDTRDKALELAKEQGIYNADIIYQGAGSLQALANSLINQKVWFFWWD